MVEKPLKERLRQDLAILLVALLLAGGSLPVLAVSPYFVPAMALFMILTFGPYALEFAKQMREGKKAEKKKIIIKGINQDGNGMKISSEWR
ncbi:MAG: hypothetical protein MN733_27185 [Nitrososphaera sp.]|nr:hypothetical protein [Nitrososphaera sp.]